MYGGSRRARQTDGQAKHLVVQYANAKHTEKHITCIVTEQEKIQALSISGATATVAVGWAATGPDMAWGASLRNRENAASSQDLSLSASVNSIKGCMVFESLIIPEDNDGLKSSSWHKRQGVELSPPPQKKAETLKRSQCLATWSWPVHEILF